MPEADALETGLRKALALVRHGDRLPADAAVRLARGLITRESAVGGPYRDDAGNVTRRFNGLVGELMRLLGSPLPNVEAYLGRTAAVRKTARRTAAHSPARDRARSVLASAEEPLRAGALHALVSILRVDEKGEISRLAELFAASLRRPVTADTDTLGAANLLTWIAYSIYDDFIDEEGAPASMPVANLAHREALSLYADVLRARSALDPDDLFAGMDAANAWELAHCRFPVRDGTIEVGRLPRYGSLSLLARRARAHVLGPLIVAEAAGAPLADCKRALDDYLIARQLNDDLHDWVEDFERGHLSPVVARLLTAVGATQGTHDVALLLPPMRTAFWETELVAISRIALRRIERAERILIRAALLPDSPFVTQVLRPIRDSLKKGLARHEDDRRFLRAYSDATSPRPTIAR